MVSWKDKEAAVRSLEENGKVDPNELVNAAMAENHPCHNDFTWDVDEATWKCWREEARSLIRKCKFEILVDKEITESVVRYVASPNPEEPVFVSLSKVRSVTKVSAVMAAEINMLHGLAARVYGIALAKQGMVGDGIVAKLGVIRDTLLELKTEMEE